MGKKQDKGTRLPADWRPSPQLYAWALFKRPDLTNTQLQDICDDFRDYWIAQPGDKGLKLDWDATFRRWIRNAWVRKNASPPPGGVCY